MLSLIVLIFSFLQVNAKVLELTDANFDSSIAKHSVALVKFYAPWCGHCKRLAPEFDSAAKELLEDDPPVTLIKVDCTKETTICGKVGVTGYPTLKIYKDGALVGDYEGPRSKDGILSHMRAQAGPAAVHFENLDQFNKLVTSNKPVFTGYFTSDSSNYAKLFQKIAAVHMMDFKFGFSTKKILPSSEKEFVRVYLNPNAKSKLEPEYYEYDGEFTETPLTKWMLDNAFGLAGHRTSDNDKFFKRPLLVLYHDFDCVRNSKVCVYWLNRLYKIGKDFIKDVKFAISDRNAMSHELTNVGITPSSQKDPDVVLFSKTSKYVMENSFSLDNLKAFVENFLNGGLTPYLKSEEIPEDNSAPVKKVVARNFDEIVNDPTKDVLIEFYAEWCGHCKSLKPIYEELATTLQNEKGITIAAMEATKNDVPQPYEVSGFPTIYFAKKGSKSAPVSYTGGREFKDFIKYLASEATDELSLYDRSGNEKKTEL